MKLRVAYKVLRQRNEDHCCGRPERYKRSTVDNAYHRAMKRSRALSHKFYAGIRFELNTILHLAQQLD